MADLTTGKNNLPSVESGAYKHGESTREFDLSKQGTSFHAKQKKSDLYVRDLLSDKVSFKDALLGCLGQGRKELFKNTDLGLG